MKTLSIKTSLIRTVVILGTLALASCSGGSGGGGGNNDQTNPDNDDTTTTDPVPTNAKVVCLQENLKSLPEDKKIVIEMSANAVIKCKANRADMEAFLKKRKS